MPKHNHGTPDFRSVVVYDLKKDL